MGGYVAGPPVMAALLRRMPVVVMEPNAIPGFTNRAIGALGRARAGVLSGDGTRIFRPGRTEVTGLPVREEFFRIPPKPREAKLHRADHRRQPGIAHAEPGRARELAAVPRGRASGAHCASDRDSASFEELRAEFAASGLEGEVVPFIADMPAAFAAADLVVCRAGRGRGVGAGGGGQAVDPGAVSVRGRRSSDCATPRPWSAAGAARLVRDAEMNGEKLFAWSRSPGRRAATRWSAWAKPRESSRSPGAARRAAEILEEVAR